MSAGGSQATGFDGTIDPVIGCDKCSSGCAFCTALANLARLGQPAGVITRNSQAEWDRIYTLPRNGLILLCSMSDFFLLQNARWRWAEMVDMMNLRPDCVFVALTKRIENAEPFVARFGVVPNLWIGISAEDQKKLDVRTPLLYATPAAGYVLSVQPQLGPTNLTQHLRNPKLNYVLVGCEKGAKARPSDRVWIDQVTRQCDQHMVDWFITRWRDRHGKLVENPTRSERGSHRQDRPSYKTQRPKTTILQMIQAKMQLRQRRRAA